MGSPGSPRSKQMPSVQNIQEPFRYNPRVQRFQIFTIGKIIKEKKNEKFRHSCLYEKRKTCCSLFHALLQRLNILKRRKQINLDEFSYQEAKENQIIYTNPPTSSAFSSSKRQNCYRIKTKSNLQLMRQSHESR